ncbi:MAG: TVP38/TMEM64 family protein [Ruminococcaceae bacterium]|nr:TVP38/TMEM64 family protein [Oscillospiraceae bacterium]
MNERQRKMAAAAGFIVFILFLAAVFVFIGRPLIEFVSEPEQFREWVDEHGFSGKLLFLGMVILQVFVAFIPGEPMEIGAGYAFGAVEGTLLCLMGCAIGSALVFLFVRRFGKKAAAVFFSEEKLNSFRLFRNPRRLKRLMFLLFLLPGTPKDMLTYAAGLAPITLPQFLLISMTARIPSIITSTVGGNALGSENYSFALIVFAATLAISAIGSLVYGRIKKV